MISFGPVPSRRLGRSLGINNIPAKICSYACVYCQVGKTIRMQIDRAPFFQPEEILRDVESKIEKAQQKGESIDYLTFVPDGEPSLDANLGKEIDLLRPLGFKIAVITNGSLIWREDVRSELAKADWVSLKIDTLIEKKWRRINRPQGSLKQKAILRDMAAFALAYSGTLVTETMLVRGLNDGVKGLRKVAVFLNQLQPRRAYLSVPIRPPAEKWVRPPEGNVLNQAFQVLDEKRFQVEYLIGYEGNSFAFTGDAENDLLSITAVHPMRQDAVNEFLMRAGTDWHIVHKLMAQSQLVEAEYEGKKFYMRNFSPKHA
ncbi:MAG: radical SAM protein [Desulfobacterales bacterium]|jgi:wyosine [tRNA(Phe)-imidazoG37] synthetase (radical SAM superfamily)